MSVEMMSVISLQPYFLIFSEKCTDKLLARFLSLKDLKESMSVTYYSGVDTFDRSSNFAIFPFYVSCQDI